jgi:hypothetical protein
MILASESFLPAAAAAAGDSKRASQAERAHADDSIWILRIHKLQHLNLCGHPLHQQMPSKSCIINSSSTRHGLPGTELQKAAASKQLPSAS